MPPPDPLTTALTTRSSAALGMKVSLTVKFRWALPRFRLPLTAAAGAALVVAPKVFTARLLMTSTLAPVATLLLTLGPVVRFRVPMTSVAKPLVSVLGVMIGVGPPFTLVTRLLALTVSADTSWLASAPWKR